MSDENTETISIVDEGRKRTKEKLTALLLGFVFLFLTWLEFRLFDLSQDLPFEHSIFFFGLVNFNIILFLFILFLIFRNVVKAFSESQKGIGGTLKGKLIISFVAFSSIPTILMFLISVFYINNSFEKWFSQKMSGILKSSLEVTTAYHNRARKQNYHFAHEIVSYYEKHKPSHDNLQMFQKRYSLDAVEYYPDFLSNRVLSISQENIGLDIPRVSLEFLRKALVKKNESSIIHHFSEGNLIRVIVPLKAQTKGALVVSTYVPLSLLSRMNDIEVAYEKFRDVDPLEYHLKSIYITILVLISFTILLFASWFGVYLARQLSIPLDALRGATRDVAKGHFNRVKVATGSQEIQELIHNFNSMTVTLEESERELQETNQTLRKALTRLDEHTKYIEVVLSNVSTGVISLNKDGFITMVNKRAEKLLGVTSRDIVGKNIADVLSNEYMEMLHRLSDSIKRYHVNSIQKELSVLIKGKTLPIQTTLTILNDDRGSEIGKVLVIDDLTPVVKAQRAAAWREVARRIAHEIKNPLTPIKLSAQRLQKKFAHQIEDEAFKNCTSMIIDQVDNLKTLVNEFHNFARLPKATPELTDLNQVIEQSLMLYRTTHDLEESKSRLQIDFEKDSSLPYFYFDPGHIQRVITNLVDNSIRATQHLGARGQISIRTEYNSQIRIVKVVVEDNGDGIPKELLDRIFEPYVTTKEQGTGLGLAIVKRTIEDHNGFIRAYQSPSGGTRIVIELPVEDTIRPKETDLENPDLDLDR